MFRPVQFRRFLQASLATAALTGDGVLLDTSLLRPGYSAEEIRISTVRPMVLTISVDALETFAETGKIRKDLPLYAGSFLALLHEASLLFSDPAQQQRRGALMQVVGQGWRMQVEQRSPGYTTRWGELVVVG